MDEGQKILLKVEMQFGTAFKIGLGMGLAWLIVFLVPWIIISLVAMPLAR